MKCYLFILSLLVGSAISVGSNTYATDGPHVQDLRFKDVEKRLSLLEKRKSGVLRKNGRTILFLCAAYGVYSFVSHNKESIEHAIGFCKDIYLEWQKEKGFKLFFGKEKKELLVEGGAEQPKASQEIGELDSSDTVEDN